MKTRDHPLRDKLDRARGHPVSDDVWAQLNQDGWVADADLTDDVPLLCRKATDLERYQGTSARDEQVNLMPRSRRGRHQERSAAISDAYAVMARRRPDVAGFRETVLGGRLLRHEEVASWIKSQAEGTASQRPPGNAPFVAWGAPGAAAAELTPASSADLERLAALAETLSKSFGWGRAQSTIFVLCDLVPYVAPVEIRYKMTSAPLARSRFVLTVDPAVTPVELAEAYSRARGRKLSGQPKKLGAKALELAVFGVENEGLEGLALLRKWNRFVRKDHPGKTGDRETWIYAEADLHNFTRDIRTAVRRLVNPPWALAKEEAF